MLCAQGCVGTAGGRPPAAHTWGSQAAARRLPATVNKPERLDGPPGGSSGAPPPLQHHPSVNNTHLKSGPSAAPRASALRTLPPQEGALTANARLAGGQRHQVALTRHRERGGVQVSGETRVVCGSGGPILPSEVRGPPSLLGASGFPQSVTGRVVGCRSGQSDSAQGSSRPHILRSAGSVVSRGTGLGQGDRRCSSPREVWARPRPCRLGPAPALCPPCRPP